MSQSQLPSIQKKLHLSAAWSCGPRTLQWERLWWRILSNTITKESRLKEEVLSTDGVIDGL